MNDVITLPRLIDLLSRSAGVDKAVAERFIRDFFSVAESALLSDGQVTIKGFGTFKLDDSLTDNIRFIPDKEISDAINMPFAFFEAVELSDGITEEILNGHETTDADTTHDSIEPLPETDSHVVLEKQDSACDDIQSIEAEPSSGGNMEVPDTQQHSEAEDTETVTGLADQGNADQCDIFDTQSGEYGHKRHHDTVFWAIWSLLIGIIFGLAAGYFMHDTIEGFFMPAADEESTVMTDETDDDALTMESIERNAVIEPQSHSVASEEMPEKEIYDTITSKRFLTTMARQYYGRMEYWVYIYKENADILKNPDRIKPGTIVRIPPFGKYATEASDSLNLEKAKASGAEIYSRYR